MRGTFSPLAAIGLSVTITTATGCFQKATGPEQDKTASDAMPVTASTIRRDEEVVFFPTCAHLDEDRKTWPVPVHGIIYEPEADSRKRHAMVRALARTLQVEDGTEEAENLDRRLRLFLVDNERGKSLSVRIGGKVTVHRPWQFLSAMSPARESTRPAFKCYRKDLMMSVSVSLIGLRNSAQLSKR